MYKARTISCIAFFVCTFDVAIVAVGDNSCNTGTKGFPDMQLCPMPDGSELRACVRTNCKCPTKM